VSAAYFWNKKQEEQMHYNYKNPKEEKSLFGSNDDERMFKSWHKDPNIGNR
jgi:hypothetical protein